MKSTILLLLIVLSCASCCTIHRASRVQSPEMSNALESYYETVWNRENNLPGEHRQELRNVRKVLKDSKSPVN